MSRHRGRQDPADLSAGLRVLFRLFGTAPLSPVRLRQGFRGKNGHSLEAHPCHQVLEGRRQSDGLGCRGRRGGGEHEPITVSATQGWGGDGGKGRRRPRPLNGSQARWGGGREAGPTGPRVRGHA